MKRRVLLWALGTLLAAGVCPAQEPDRQAAVANAQLLADVRALREQVRELRARKDALQARLAKLSVKSWEINRRTHLALRVPLPAARTENAIREFLRTLGAISDNQKNFGSIDAQVEMIRALGPSSVPVIIEELTHPNENIADSFSYVHLALEWAMLRPEHKPYLLEAVGAQRSLIDIAMKKGWTEEIKGALVSALHEHPKFLPDDWIRAVASFQDPETYEDLRWYLENGISPYETCKAIKDLPGFDDEEVVRIAWHRATTENLRNNVKAMAAMAVLYGYADALEMAVNTLGREPKLFDPEGVYGAERIVAAALPFVGTNEEVKRWYAEHKDELVFDKAERRFKLKETAP